VEARKNVGVVLIGLLAAFAVSSEAAAQSRPQPPLQPQMQRQTPPGQRPPRVFLNGQAVDDIRGVSLIDMAVTLDAWGNIQMFNPAYRVLRRPGAAAQIVRLPADRVGQPTPATTTPPNIKPPPMPTGPPTQGRVFLVAEAQNGLAPFQVHVLIGGEVVASFDGTKRLTVDITRHVRQGDNIIRFRSVAFHRPESKAHATVKLTFGFGELQGKSLALDRVLLVWARTGLDRGRWLEDRTLTLDR